MTKADFEIKRKKSKHKSKRRHTVCEGDKKELEEALQNITMVNNSCQTEEPPPPDPPSFFSFRRSFSRKKRVSDVTRRETVALDGLTLDFSKKDDDSSAASQDRNGTMKKDSHQKQSAKSSKTSLMSRAAKINPISSLSAAISMAVKMRHPKSSGKQDDGRSSSGNWSASSSTRASLDSDHHHAVNLAVDRTSNVSRNSAGKDSVLSDATTATTATAHPESGRPSEHSAVNDLPKFSNKTRTLKWDYENGRESNTSTPERTSDCGSTPLVMSPYIRRKQPYAASLFDDGESSVYSVDTDGYYTSMHTDSGLWNALNGIKSNDNQSDSIRSRRRQESQSSVSTIGNGSINSFLSKVVTENDNSSNCSSLKRSDKPVPEPPPRVSSFQDGKKNVILDSIVDCSEKFEKDGSPPKNGSASESDYESRDRIRVKTMINSSRYPSLVAVSPETSDDELSEMQKQMKAPTKSIVVAEVHREENRDDDTSGSEASSCPGANVFPKTTLKSSHQPPGINMYGGDSPTESIFSTNLVQNGNSTSTPKQKTTITSFTSDLPELSGISKEAKSRGSPSLVQKLVSDLKNMPSPKKETIVRSPSAVKKESRTLIPLKYTQRITVTPIVRNEEPENNKNLSNTPPQRTRNFLKNPLSSLPFRHGDTSNTKPKSPSYISFQSPDSPVSSSTSLTPDTGKVASPPTTKSVARVTLDPSGKVIYSSSSLDRNAKENRGSSSFPRNEPKYATLPKYQPPFFATNCGKTPEVKTEITNVIPRETRIPVPRNVDISRNSHQLAPPAVNSSNSSNLLFRPSRGGRFCRTYFPSHIISPVPQCTSSDKSSTLPDSSNVLNNNFSSPSPLFGTNSCSATTTPNTSRFSTLPSVTCQTASSSSRDRATPSPKLQEPVFHSAKKPPVEYRTFIQSSPSTYHFRPVTASPERTSDTSAPRSRSLSPCKTTLHSASKVGLGSLTPRSLSKLPITTVHQFEKTDRLNKVSEFTPSNPPDVIPSGSTPPSTLDVTVRTARSEQPSLKSPSDASNLKSLSSSELFAIIHSSKKKHNIKSDSEKSLSPLSSRSSSPGNCLTPSPVKAPKIETGVLTRHGRDNTSSPSPRPETPSTANDRLGRSKPTSMHDFKMLLLQARVGGNESSSRPTAAELLKVSPPRNSGRSSPSTLPRLSPKLPTPRKDPVVSGQITGHSTLPVKRITRTRSPYLSRYDSTYPPIWEDCSEDMEAADENQNRVNNSTTRSPSNALSDTQMYSSNLNYTTVLDNEKPPTQATSTWV